LAGGSVAITVPLPYRRSGLTPSATTPLPPPPQFLAFKNILIHVVIVQLHIYTQKFAMKQHSHFDEATVSLLNKPFCSGEAILSLLNKPF
jgi:hypothetical protein